MHRHDALQAPGMTPADWEQWLAHRFVPGCISLDADGPGGLVGQAISAGPLRLTPLAVWPQTITHTAQHLAALPADDRASVLAHIVVEGEGFIEQGGAALRFQAGDVSFRNLQQSSRVVFQTTGQLVAVRLPASVLHWHQMGRFVQQRDAPRVIPSGGLLSQLPSPQKTPLGNLYSGFALPWLFAAAYHDTDEGMEPTAAPNAVRWQQVLSFVEAYLFDARALTPTRCAREVGISERYLHKLAAWRGETFATLVKHRRLVAALALLESPAGRSLSIASVADQCGFNDPAHFSRVFRQRFGKSPSQIRKRGAGFN